MIKRPMLRYHGGKFRLSGWIRSFFPPHQIYVEPFGGAGSVLLTKEPAYAEVYNDLDGDVVNFFRVLRNPEHRAQLCEMIALTPFSREEFERAHEPTDDVVERARRLESGLITREQMDGATKYELQQGNDVTQ